MVIVAAIMMAIIIATERILELFLANRNRKKVLQLGALEFGRGHYPMFFLLHIGWFAGWLYEASQQQDFGGCWQIWLGAFILAESLRYWCIISLGDCWNTRILIIPGAARVCRGPYRFLAHPNYLAVALELLSVPMIFGAATTAVIVSLLNAGLLLGIRIPAEKKALELLKT